MTITGDEESHQRRTRISVVSLNTWVITLWTLSGIIILVIVALYAKGLVYPLTSARTEDRRPQAHTQPQSQNQSRDHLFVSEISTHNVSFLKLMIFKVDSRVLAVDISKPELKSKFLFNDERSPSSSMSDNSYQLSEDGEHVYVLGENSSIRIFDIDNMSFIDLTVSIPELNNFVFTTKNEGEEDYFIRQFNFNESRIIQDYPHKCQCCHVPVLANRFSNDSKIFYNCTSFKQIFMKKLNCPEEEDTEVFSLSGPHEKYFLSPENSKAIIYSIINRRYWTIKDLSKPEEPAKRVYFDTNLSLLRSFSFSKDHKTLYIIMRTCPSICELFTIDFERLFANDYSNFQLPYELGPGRPISVH